MPQPSTENANRPVPPDSAAFSAHDSYSAHPGVNLPHDEASQHLNMVKQLQRKVQKFIHHVMKALQILLGQDHEEPGLKESMKRFSLAIRKVAQSPKIANDLQHSLPRFQEALINTSDLPEDEKQTLRAQITKPVPPEHAQAIVPEVVANIFDTFSEVLESGQAEEGLMQTMRALPDLITAAHESQQAEEAQHTADESTKRAYIAKMSDEERQGFFSMPGSTQQKHLKLFQNMNQEDREKFLKLPMKTRTARAETAAKEQAKYDQIKREAIAKQQTTEKES